MEDNKDTYTELDLAPIENSSVEIAQKILNEDNFEEVKKYIQLFNLNQSKKDVMRVMKLGALLDKVSDQMIERFEKRPGEFSNSDLLNYLQVTQSAIEKANKSLNLVDETPAIAFQQNNQVNINLHGGLDQESKSRVIAAIQSILQKSNNNSTYGHSDEIIETNIVENTSTDMDSSPTQNSDSEKTTAKRKRGRPRKEEVR